MLASRPPQVVALYQDLRRRIDDQLPGTEWRATSLYVAAASAGHIFLSVKFRKESLLLGLTLPTEMAHPRISDDAGEFNWSRMTKVARITDDVSIDDDLLALVR